VTEYYDIFVLKERSHVSFEGGKEKVLPRLM